MMKAVFMAGGKGTRISSVFKEIPKPLIKIDGKPILEHGIDCLKAQGYRDIIITVGHLGELIIDYFGDGSGVSPSTGKPFGVKIQYYYEKKPLGNAGALLELRDILTEDFLLVNADVLFDINIDRFVSAHNKNPGLITLFTHPNNHPYDSTVLKTNAQCQVIKWFLKNGQRPKYYHNEVNAGLHILNPQVFDLFSNADKGTVLDLDKDIIGPYISMGKVYAYKSAEYVKDMGTPDRYYSVCDDFISGKVSRRNLLNKQKALFIDRDGTINRYAGFLNNIDSFELLNDVSRSVKLINESEYLAIVVTNQPVIARGELTFEELNEIHDKMETLLGNDGAYLDGIYYCPHHPHKGFEGERPEFKIDCECRKPKPGMIFQAAKDFNIDLSESWIIGDGERDILAGKSAYCKTALIGTEDFEQDLSGNSLFEIVNKIINGGKD